jgi:FdhD protein
MTVGEAPKIVSDTLAAGEPLELQAGGRSLAVTMRTPGADFDIAAGFLVSEGVIAHTEELVTMRYCTGVVNDVDTFNAPDFTLASDVALADYSVTRAFFTTSSFGLCGKTSIDAVRIRSRFDVRDDALRVDTTMLASLPARLRDAQQVFEKTGTLHRAALFDGPTVAADRRSSCNGRGGPPSLQHPRHRGRAR